MNLSLCIQASAAGNKLKTLFGLTSVRKTLLKVWLSANYIGEYCVPWLGMVEKCFARGCIKKQLNRSKK